MTPRWEKVRSAKSDTAQRSIDEETARAARLFVTSVSGSFPVRGAVLFGSRARGDFRADSDADIAYDVLLETGIHIEPLPLWQEDWDHPETFSNPALIEGIRREGIPL